jgi:hypothetical protein
VRPPPLTYAERKMFKSFYGRDALAIRSSLYG